MPQTTADWFRETQARLADVGYVETGWQQWASWPWTGEQIQKPLDPPADVEPDRRGVETGDCFVCRSVTDLDATSVVWHDDDWFLGAPHGSSPLPFATFLMPTRHADLADLTDVEAARGGVLLTALERAAMQILEVPRIQVARWGDGQAHLHWWVFARPTGMLQMRGTFLSHWADVLPPRPGADLRSDLDAVGRRLVESVGGTLTT